MHNIWLIARREYLERIKTKAFLIATILIPVLLGGLGFGSGFLAQRTKASAHIAILSSDPVFAADLKQELEQGKDSNMRVDLEPRTDAALARVNAALKDSNKQFAGYLQVVPPAEPGARPRFVYRGRSASDIGTDTALKQSIKAVLTRERLTGRGMGTSDIEALLAPVEIENPETGDTTAAFFGAYILFILMYMVIMLYSMNTARSIIEEKSSRIFEVLLSTITADELLAGKILGVGAVGLTQTSIWMSAAGLLGVYFAGSFSGSAGHSIITVSQMLFFVLYFVFAFLLYSAIAAGLGATTNSEQELQQLNMFLVLPLAFCMLMLVSVIKSPDSTLSKVVSLIPFCSPLIMNLRISIGSPQPWEIWLSFVLMSISILGILWVSSRIYRVGILMYGKKPNLPEILRWLKYS
jgi:ABC-2 type transport system permease protein